MTSLTWSSGSCGACFDEIESVTLSHVCMSRGRVGWFLCSCLKHLGIRLCLV